VGQYKRAQTALPSSTAKNKTEKCKIGAAKVRRATTEPEKTRPKTQKGQNVTPKSKNLKKQTSGGQIERSDSTAELQT